MRHVVAALAAGLVAAASGAVWSRPEAGVPAVAGSPGLEHVESLSGGATSADGLPLVFAIHGLGDRPESFAGILDGFGPAARIVVPRAPRPWGPGFAWMPGRTHPGRARAEVRSADRIATLIRRLRPGAEARPVVITGFSQGGIMSFLVAVRHPDLVRGAVPVSGYLPTGVHPARRRDGVRLPPIRAIHGTVDRVLSVRGARASVQRLRDRGWDAELSEHEGVGHTVSDAMLAELHGTLAELLRLQ